MGAMLEGYVLILWVSVYTLCFMWTGVDQPYMTWIIMYCFVANAE